MKIPVIIPARNEEAFIGECLRSLDSSTTEPIVVVNDSSDKTVEIARSFGVAVVETEVQGKLPAIQTALRLLNPYDQHVIILDADTRPVMPRRWIREIVRPNDTGAVLRTGPNIFVPDGRNIVNCMYRSIKAEQEARKKDTRYVAEANMAMRLPAHTLEAVIALTHVFPGEGVYIRDCVLGDGGTYEHAGLGASAWTSSRSVSALKDRRNWLADYTKRAPEGSVVPEMFL